jgi:hypothetical protein
VASRCKQTTPSLWPKPKPDDFPEPRQLSPFVLSGSTADHGPFAGACWVEDRWSGSPRPRQCSERGTPWQDRRHESVMTAGQFEGPGQPVTVMHGNTQRPHIILMRAGSTGPGHYGGRRAARPRPWTHGARETTTAVLKLWCPPEASPTGGTHGQRVKKRRGQGDKSAPGRERHRKAALIVRAVAETRKGGFPVWLTRMR